MLLLLLSLLFPLSFFLCRNNTILDYVGIVILHNTITMSTYIAFVYVILYH